MSRQRIDNEMSLFAHKNVSVAKNTVFSISMVLLVLLTAAQNGHSINATAVSPNADSVFHRIETSIRQLQEQFWRQNRKFLRMKKKKLAENATKIGNYILKRLNEIKNNPEILFPGAKELIESCLSRGSEV